MRIDYKRIREWIESQSHHTNLRQWPVPRTTVPPLCIRDEATEARDKYIYDEWCKGTAAKAIGEYINRMSGWDPIESASGIRAAARRYAERHRLPMPLPRKIRRKD